MTVKIKVVTGLVAVGLLTLFAGCAAPARLERMVPESKPVSRESPLRGVIALVEVGGGEETNPWLLSKVGNDALEGALRHALEQQGLLSREEADASFRLKVFLIELKQPLAGFTLIVDSFVRYTLIRADDKKVVFDEIIHASGTATVGEVFDGVERLRVANERAIRTNIAAFLEHLQGLDLPPLSAQLERVAR